MSSIEHSTAYEEDLLVAFPGQQVQIIAGSLFGVEGTVFRICRDRNILVEIGQGFFALVAPDYLAPLDGQSIG